MAFCIKDVVLVAGWDENDFGMEIDVAIPVFLHVARGGGEGK